MSTPQALTARTFDPTKVIFGQTLKVTTPNKFQRVPISYQYPEGIHKLVLMTPILRSFGLLENKNQNTNNIEGYSFPFSMYENIISPTEEEEDFANLVELVTTTIRNHMAKPSTIAESRRVEPYFLNIVSQKDGAPPVIYAKLLTAFKKDKTDHSPPKITTPFRRLQTDEEIESEGETHDGYTTMEPLEMLKRRCNVVGALSIDSIFIGGIVSIQKRLKEIIIVNTDVREDSMLKSFVHPNRREISVTAQRATEEENVDDIEFDSLSSIVVAKQYDMDNE